MTVSLTDPELDLLREMLDDDPGDEAFLIVGAELVRRALWTEANDRLRAGLKADASHQDAWGLLARAALEIGDFDSCLEACARAGVDPELDAEVAKVQILALERAGRFDQAQQAIEAYVAVIPDDVVVESVRERLDAPDPGENVRLPDPLLSVRRAEAYVNAGRADRAVRLYRRLAFHFPEDLSLQGRLRRLGAVSVAEDDLSEEIIAPDVIPPEFSMPSPGLRGLAGSETVPPPAPRTAEPGANLGPQATVTPGAVGMTLSGADLPQLDDHFPESGVWDDEPTDLHPRKPSGQLQDVARSPTGRKRRRSLINR